MTLTQNPLPGSECPMCGKLLDQASSLAAHSPGPGDLAVCVYCASVLQFDDMLILWPLGQAEINALHPEIREMVRHHQRIVRTMDRRTLR